ncbi:MAG TPA: hypothetical protein VKY92_16370 [Verrucomicrobiae bacterium]|nr:hypothetical protein [Verrucomicrobiae bacterium]
MKGAWQREQRTADEIKEKPGNHQSHGAAPESQKARPSRPLEDWHRGERSKAVGTNDLVIVFGDTFAAEKTAAAWTTRHGFPLRVVKAALVGQVTDHAG